MPSRLNPCSSDYGQDIASRHAPRSTTPAKDVPFVLQWLPSRIRSPAVARFVAHVLAAPLPDGWNTQPGHRLNLVPPG